MQAASDAESLDDVDTLSILFLYSLLNQPVFNEKLTEDESAQLLTISPSTENATSDNSGVATYSIIDDLLSIIDQIFTFYTEADVNCSTLDGNRVILYKAKSELESSTINQIKNSVASSYPNVTAIADPTSKYNCHSYAWYSQSSQNVYWVNDPTPYTTDSHNTKLSAPTVGCICVYLDSNNEPLHSAVVISVTSSTNFTVRSKWGKWGLYEHAYDDVPSSYKANGTSVKCEFYKRATSHTYASAYAQYNTTYHTRMCTVCNHIGYFNHNYTVTKYDSALHYLKCKNCSYTTSASHTFNTLTGACTTCSYSGAGVLSLSKRLVEYNDAVTCDHS